MQQIKPKSLAWGFIFRRHDQQPTSFQPEQYKAIAPVSVSEANQTKASKASKASKAAKKPPLGVNATCRSVACDDFEKNILFEIIFQK